MINLKRIILLSTCLTILFVVPFVRGQETQTVLKPNQLVTFSLAPEQEKVFVLQMKKGDFAEIQSSAREGLRLSFEIYDSARKELLEGYYAGYIWFVAPRDGDFILVSKLEEEQYFEFSDAQKISIQYNNKFRLPPETKLKGIRKVNGFDVKIMMTKNPAYEYERKYTLGIGSRITLLLIEKNGQLQKAMRFYPYDSVSFGDDISRAYSAKEKRSIQLIKTTLDKTGDGIPDIMVDIGGCGASNQGRGNCTEYTYFIDLGDTVKISEILNGVPFTDGGLLAIGKNPKGGLLFELSDKLYFGSSLVILEFRNGVLRPNFDLMKKPAPSLAVLRSKAQKFRNQSNLKPYKGVGNESPGLYIQYVLYKPSFAVEMIDLIYTGNEELAWQFLDLVWSPQKQGKEIFIKDFKNQLLESRYWQMILEDRKK